MQNAEPFARWATPVAGIAPPARRPPRPICAAPRSRGTPRKSSVRFSPAPRIRSPRRAPGFAAGSEAGRVPFAAPAPPPDRGARPASSVWRSSKKSSSPRQRRTPMASSVASAASSGLMLGPSSVCSTSLAYAPSASTRRRVSNAIFLALLIAKVIAGGQARAVGKLSRGYSLAPFHLHRFQSQRRAVARTHQYFTVL